MSITFLDDIPRYPSEGEGYKLLAPVNKYANSNPVTAIWGRVEFPPWQWVRDSFDSDFRISRIAASQGKFYDRGFHLFPSMDDVWQFLATHQWWAWLSLYRVQYKELIATGIYAGANTIVAKEVMNTGLITTGDLILKDKAPTLFQAEWGSTLCQYVEDYIPGERSL